MGVLPPYGMSGEVEPLAGLGLWLEEFGSAEEGCDAPAAAGVKPAGEWR